ncbi:MAG: prepilin-type N-terminal cleavage/methylation domain-containing protein [Planctomycetota bacterium]
MKRATGDSRRGFTLVELMIVVAVIVTIAAIAIPNLLRSRMAANETATIGTLRTLATEQALFVKQAEVDQDSDGVGEYGWLCEMAGEVCVRNIAGTPNPTPLYTVYITQNLATGGATGTGYGEKSGYMYRMYLPIVSPTGVAADGGDDRNTDGTPTTWGTPLDPMAVRDVINMQENNFVCQAWPVVLGNTGQRCFVVTPVGEVFGSKMTNQTYNGEARQMDDYRFCFSSDGDGSDGWWNDRLAAGGVVPGNDGNVYNPAQ